jgi:hypothetical protein
MADRIYTAEIAIKDENGCRIIKLATDFVPYATDDHGHNETVHKIIALALTEAKAEAEDQDREDAHDRDFAANYADRIYKIAAE